MLISFQYINIRHILGMYITKQAEQEIYLIAQDSNDAAPLQTHTHTHTQTAGVKSREKKEETARYCPCITFK